MRRSHIQLHQEAFPRPQGGFSSPPKHLLLSPSSKARSFLSADETILISAMFLPQLIGEETSAATGTAELTDDPTWIVDPLDGTTNFVHG